MKVIQFQGHLDPYSYISCYSIGQSSAVAYTLGVHMNIEVIVLFVGSYCLEVFIQQNSVWFFLAENGGKCSRTLTVYIYVFDTLIFPPFIFSCMICSCQ